MEFHPARLRPLALAVLAVATGACLGLLALRPLVVGAVGQLYLVWNLFLAWIPFVVALLFYDRARARRGGLAQVGLFAAWLLFFPNAPYIVSDFTNLPQLAEPPKWFDTTVYCVFAGTGMLLGLVSLYLVHRAVRSQLGSLIGWAMVGVSSVLGGLGVYLGRVLRWNSWDVVTQPIALLGDLVQVARDPVGRPLTVTVAFAVAVGVAYLALYALIEPRLDRATPV